MRAYVLTSGLLFLVLGLAHAARFVAEGSGPLHNPLFVASAARLGHGTMGRGHIQIGRPLRACNRWKADITLY